MLLGVLDEGDGEGTVVLGDDGEGDAVDGDGALDDGVAEDVRGCAVAGEEGVLLRGEGEEGAGGLDDAADEVAGEAAGELEGALQVDGVAGEELAEVGAAVGLGHAVEVEGLFVEVDDGEVDAVDGDGVAEVGAAEAALAGDAQAAAVGLFDGADLFDDAGEHGGASNLELRA